MHPASLPGRAEQHRRDGLLEPGVGIGDDQLHPTQAAGFEAAQKRGPERPVLGVAHGEPEDFPPTVGPNPGGDYDSLRHDPVVHPGLAVGGIQEHVRKLLAGQGAVPERAHFLVQVSADPRHLRLGDTRIRAQRFDQVVDLARRDAVQVGLHHHREQGLVDPAAPVQQGGEERAGAQLGDPQRKVAGVRRQGAGARPVALRGPCVGPFPGLGADRRGELGVDQGLVHRLGRDPDPFAGVTGLERVQDLQ